MSSCFLFLFLCLTHKPDVTKINIDRFDMAKSAAQLQYGPVLVIIYLVNINEMTG